MFGYKRWFCLIGIGIFAFGCTKQVNEPTPDLGLSYYPLSLNSAIVYDVDSTVYDDFTGISTKYTFQLKDSITSKIKDALNQDVYRVERYKKKPNENWAFQRTITRNIVANRAEEFMDNRRFVRLVFPLVLNVQWNGNLYNNLESWPYQITKLNEASTINNKKIDSTLTVSQYNEINLIREDVYSEVYAKHIGLVMKDIRALDKNINTGAIRRGLIYKMQFNSKK